MLRAFVLAVGLLCLAGAVVLEAAVPSLWPGSMQLFAFGAILAGSILFERHYRSRAAVSQKPLQSTGERFVDPVTGILTEVFYDPATGERVYRQM